MTDSTEAARRAFTATCTAAGTDPIAAETAVLSAGRGLLPPFALAVLDGGDGTAEYWRWLENEVVKGAEGSET